MPDNRDIQKDYAKYRIKRSKEDLDAVHLLFDSGNYRIANNRGYYAIFHALRAVLIFDNFDSGKHSGVIAEFRRRYMYAHIAISVGSRGTVDEMMEKLYAAGYEIVSGPRTTGDGYYESCIIAIEDNQIEITI